MKVYLKSLNACLMRNQKVLQYSNYLQANNHIIVDHPEKAECILIWTCAFRADHRDAGLTKIDYYIENYKAIIIVAGCLPDIAPYLLEHYGNKVTIVNWKNDVKLLDKMFSSSHSLREFNTIMVEEKLCEDAFEFRKRHPDKPVTFHDQFIKVLISEGCNHNCTYCSELTTFPPYKSFTTDQIKTEVAKVVSNTGVSDIVLLADSLGQFGSDIKETLPQLISTLSTINKNIKIALNNLHLINLLEYYDEIITFVNRCIIKHINLPIQSGSDRILKLMKRKYTSADIEKVFSHFNTIGFREFDTHIIVGFPTEEEEDFKRTLSMIIKYRPKYVLASKYMEAKFAKSSEIFPKVPEKIINTRLERIASSLKDVGIICNCDGSDLSLDRFKRLYKD